MANITLLPSAKVPLIYEGDNTMTTEWYRFFWNIYGFTGTGVIPVDKGGTGLDTIGNHQLIIGNANNVFEPASLSSASIAITYPAGFINLELGTSGVTPGTYGSASTVGVFTVNAYGVLTAASNTSIGIDASQIISGTLPVIRGGTGQSTYTDGQLLIGNSTGNTLTKAILTAGTGISVTNGAGSITIANTGVLSVSGTAPVVSSGGATPAISMAAANTTTNGYLTSTDWNTFNNKAPATSGTSILYGNGSGGFSNVTIGTGISFAGGTLSATGSGGTVTSVSGTGTVNGITLTGTITSSGNLTLGGTLSGIGNSQLTNSTISGVALGGNLFNLTAGTGVSFSAGTTYNGSAAITINATGSGGTVTSVAALTLGTTGTDLSSTVANGTTTPVITLNVPTASAANRGALSAADWTTFNSKAPGVTFTTGYIPFGQGTTTLNQDAALFWDNTNKRLGVGTATPSTLFHISGTSTTAIARIASTSNGTSTFTGAGAGLELTAAGMNDASATYGPAIKFGSTDAELTTTNPKFGAAILAKAAQAYTSDTTGGMDLLFWTSPINPGTGNGLVERARLWSSGGWSIGNTTDPGATNLSVTGTVQSGNILLNTNTISTTNTNGNLVLAPNGTGYVSMGGADPRILLQNTGTYSLQFRIVSNVAVVGSTNATPLSLQTGGTNALYISTARGVSIGNTTDAGANNLSVTGTGKFGTTVGVGAATPSASGAGITFPATQSASTNANTLDDYEEGTYTPVLTAGTGSITSYTATGIYTKIGNLVTVTVNSTITNAGTGAGSLIVTAPFTNNATVACIGVGREHALTGYILQVSIGVSGTSFDIRTYANGTPIATNAQVRFTITYSV